MKIIRYIRKSPSLKALHLFLFMVLSWSFVSSGIMICNGCAIDYCCPQGLHMIMQDTFENQMPVAIGCCSKEINGYCNILSTSAIELQTAISASNKSAEKDSFVQTFALTTYNDSHKLIVKSTFALSNLAVDSPPIFLQHQSFLIWFIRAGLCLQTPLKDKLNSKAFHSVNIMKALFM